MKLQDIDKAKYDKHFKILFLGIVVFMLAIALASSSILIQLIGSPESGSNFMLNLIGVAISAFITGIALKRYKKHSFMHEVMYVWELKKQLNKIQRKKTKLEAAVDNGNENAMTALLYLYTGSKQLYELDNNTITMEELNNSLNQLKNTIEEKGYNIETDNYNSALLNEF